jgi:hypothetical protein
MFCLVFSLHIVSIIRRYKVVCANWRGIGVPAGPVYMRISRVFKDHKFHWMIIHFLVYATKY